MEFPEFPLSDDAKQLIDIVRQNEKQCGIKALTTGYLICALWLSDVYEHRDVLHKAVDPDTFAQVMLDLWGIRTGVAVSRYQNRYFAREHLADQVLYNAWDIDCNYESSELGLTSIARTLIETEPIEYTLEVACKRLGKSFNNTLRELQDDLFTILEDDFADRRNTIADTDGADMSMRMSDSAQAAYLRSMEIGLKIGVEKAAAPCFLYAMWDSAEYEHRKLLHEAIPPTIFFGALEKAWAIYHDDDNSDRVGITAHVRMLEMEPFEHYRVDAERLAKKVGHKEVTPTALLIAMVCRGSTLARTISFHGQGALGGIGKGEGRLADLALKLTALLQDEADAAQHSSTTSGKDIVMAKNIKAKWVPAALGDGDPNKPLTPLQQFGTDLTVKAFQGKLEEVVGRDKEIAQAIEILSRRTKKNPILVGEAGTGKTAIVDGIAQRIVDGDVPDTLRNKRLFSVAMSLIVAGTSHRGDFEKRMTDVIKQAIEVGAILFIDETHTLVGAGKSSDSPLDASNMLKSQMASSELSVIGATTIEEYRKYILKDAALVRRFSELLVGEPDHEATLAIMNRKRELDEKHHNVVVTDDAIEAAVKLSARYIPELFLPDKAIDLMDKACARVNNRVERVGDELPEVDATVVAEIVGEMTGIPVEDLNASQRQKLRNLEQRLQERVVGQMEAVRTLAKAVRRVFTGYSDPNKPSGCFFLLGPTGSGKTVLAKALNWVLFNNDQIIRIDMSEFQEKHTVSRLIGAPPGYVGYGEAGQLTEAVRRRPYSVVLFDEIEKAHSDVFDILLQVLDDGRLTDGQGRTVDFRNTIILFTSNIGVSSLDQGALGFGNDDASTRSDSDGYDETDGIPTRVMKEIKARFRPEFLNRLDRKILFNRLTEEDVRKIVDIELAALVNERPALENIDLVVTSAAGDLLAKKGFHSKYGARPLKRVIETLLIDELSDLELSFDDGIPDDSRVLVDAEGGKLVISLKEMTKELVRA